MLFSKHLLIELVVSVVGSLIFLKRIFSMWLEEEDFFCMSVRIYYELLYMVAPMGILEESEPGMEVSTRLSKYELLRRKEVIWVSSSGSAVIC